MQMKKGTRSGASRCIVNANCCGVYGKMHCSVLCYVECGVMLCVISSDRLPSDRLLSSG